MKLSQNRKLGLRMLDWHSGQNSGIYSVGSRLLAGHSPDAIKAEDYDRAIRELQRECGGARLALSCASDLLRLRPTA